MPTDAEIQTRRHAILQAVIAMHGEPDSECQPPGELPKWVGVERDGSDVWLTVADTLGQLEDSWRTDDSGYEPAAAVDLDGGFSYEVRVFYRVAAGLPAYRYDPQEAAESTPTMTADVFDALDTALDRYEDSFGGPEAQHYTEDDLNAAARRIASARTWLKEQGAVTSDSSSALPGA